MYARVTAQEFITTEVLRLYGLAKDPNQKTDWQKMLKFGRKKRDRVDHILVGSIIQLINRCFICGVKFFHYQDRTPTCSRSV